MDEFVVREEKGFSASRNMSYVTKIYAKGDADEYEYTYEVTEYENGTSKVKGLLPDGAYDSFEAEYYDKNGCPLEDDDD